MNPQSTAIPGSIHTKTHGHLWPISHNPGTVFNSPETQQWAVHGQPTCPTSVSPFGTEFLTHFLSYKHPSIIYSINYHINTPIQSPIATDCPRMSKNSLQFGPMFWDRSTTHSRHFLISSMHFKCQISTQTAPSILDSHDPNKKSQINSNNSVPSFGTDQTAPHGLKLTETWKNP